MDEVKKRSLDVAVKNSRPLGSHRRKELGKVSTRGTLGTLFLLVANWSSLVEHTLAKFLNITRTDFKEGTASLVVFCFVF